MPHLVVHCHCHFSHSLGSVKNYYAKVQYEASKISGKIKWQSNLSERGQWNDQVWASYVFTPNCSNTKQTTNVIRHRWPNGRFIPKLPVSFTVQIHDKSGEMVGQVTIQEYGMPNSFDKPTKTSTTQRNNTTQTNAVTYTLLRQRTSAKRRRVVRDRIEEEIQE